MSAGAALALALGLGIGGDHASGGAAPVIQPYRIMGSPGRFPNLVQPANAGANCGMIRRKMFYIGSGDGDQMKLNWVNIFGSSTTYPFTVLESCVEKEGGARVLVTYDGGSPTKAVAAGATDINSDIILPSAFGQVKFNQGDKYWWSVTISCATTGRFISQYKTNSSTGGEQTYVFDPTVVTPPVLTGGSGAFVTTGLTSSGLTLPGPIVIGRHTTTVRAFGGVGDSFFRDSISASGSYEYPLYTFADNFERALVDQNLTSFIVGGQQSTVGIMAGLNFGVYGSGLASYNPATDYRSGYYKYCTDIVDEYGTNDGALSLATIQGNLSAIWAKYKTENASMRIWRTKFIPKTTSTDSFASLVNQTYATDFNAGGKFDQLNAWFLTKKADATLEAVIEWGRVRDPADPWKWRVNDVDAGGLNGTAQMYTGDGTHPSGVAPVCIDELNSYIKALATAAPAVPTGLTLTASDTTVTAIWTPPAGPVQDYLLEYKASASGTWIPAHSYDYVTGHRWSGLTPSTSYDFRITAINYQGSSPVTAVSTIATIATPTNLLLDTLSILPTAHYATVRRRGAYLGAAWRVRRDKDGMEQNIYFTGSGDLDAAHMQAFVGSGGSGRIKRRNDHTGNTRHVQGAYGSFAVTAWPMIIVNGAMYTVNGKPAEYFDGARKYATTQINMAALSPNPTARSFVGVVKCDTVNVQHSFIGGSNSGYTAAINSTAHVYFGKTNSTTLLNSTGVVAANVASVVAGDWTGATEAAYIDGAASGTAAVAGVVMASAAANAVYGGTNTGDSFGIMLGYIPELSVNDTAVLSLADRQLLEAGMKAYWGTP